VIIVGDTGQEQIHQAKKILDQLLFSDRLQPSQIALLVAGGITDHSGFKGLNQIGAHSLTTCVKDWKHSGRVLLESSKKFKGLEADVVILAGIPVPGTSEYFTESDLYVSSSRGKHRLFLLCKSQEGSKFCKKKVIDARDL
jgi:hypothetical protein